MPRKAIIRTPSEESRHNDILKSKKQERDRKQKRTSRANLDEEVREVQNVAKRVRIQNLRANLDEQQKEMENTVKKARMQSLRSNLNDEQRSAALENNRLQQQTKRNPKDKICAGGFEINDDAPSHYGGSMSYYCMHCGAKHFENEKVSNKGMSFSNCCQHGTVAFPPLQEYPEELKAFFAIEDFRKFIRVYNNAHSFASFNADVVKFGINRPGPYAFVVQIQIYYQINTAIRNDPNEPKAYNQLYIVDPNEAAESRLATFSNLNPDITKTLSTVLNGINCQAKAFKMMNEEYEKQQQLTLQNGIDPLNLSMHFGIKPGQDQRRYNLQASNEVAAVFATTDDGEIPDSYVTVYDKDTKKLKTVNALDPNVEPWLYPIFFPHGKPIWDINLKKVNSNKRA